MLFLEDNSNFTIHVTKPPDDQWRIIKEEDRDVAEYAEIYNDNSEFTFCTLLKNTTHYAGA